MFGQETPPSILRANNPCALRPLRKGSWRGQSGVISTGNGRFCAFETPVWGVRAALRNLHTYRAKHGLQTSAQIIARWAPASDSNPQQSYTRFIAQRLDLSAHDPIPLDYEHTRRLVSAIIRFECGYDAIGPQAIAQAMALIAEEEQKAGRDPSPYIAPHRRLKPLRRSREIALGGGAASAGMGGMIAYGKEVLDALRGWLFGSDDIIGSFSGSASLLPEADLADAACIGSFLLLLVFGIGVIANRLRARFRAER